MKSHFDMFVILLIFRIISKHLFIRTPMEGLLNLNGIGLAVSRRLVDMDWILCMRRSEKGSNRPMDRSSPPVGVLIKSCSENMQQFYSRTRMPKCDFNEVVYNFIEITLRHGCSPVNVLHIFRTHFPRNTSGGLLLYSCKERVTIKCCWSILILFFFFFQYKYKLLAYAWRSYQNALHRIWHLVSSYCNSAYWKMFFL